MNSKDQKRREELERNTARTPEEETEYQGMVSEEGKPEAGQPVR